MSTAAEPEAVLEAELSGYLQRAGITLPPGRMGEVLDEYRILKQQIETVRSAAATCEPAIVFSASNAHRRTR